ncbi:MAG: hypothetical protein AAGE93_01130, partial [Bacteroidota bacterium]
MEITTSLPNDLRVILRSATWLWPEVTLAAGLVVLLLTDLVMRKKRGGLFVGMLLLTVLTSGYFL